MPDPNDPRHKGTIDPDHQPDNSETTPAEERGERIETGRHIARGGKEKGKVEGADEDTATQSSDNS